MVIANLGLRFMLELAGLAAVGYWGFRALPELPGRLLLGVGAAAALIVAWALVVAPNATNPIGPEARILIGSGLLLAAGAALAAAGEPRLALAFAAAVVVNTILLFALEHDVLVSRA